jgi:CRP-like cAMP-binding protein/Fe-S-cluster-containing hydrogenase component 2
VRGESGESTRILVLPAGSFHGEMAVMANQKEMYTVSALEPAEVLEIPKTTLNQLMSLSGVFKDRMERLYAGRAVWTHISQSPILKSLPAETLRDLLDKSELRWVEEGEVLAREGEAIDAFYLVRTGFLRVSRRLGAYGDRVLVYFREGDNFGALPLITATGKSEYTVRASTRAELVRISGADFLAAVNAHPKVRDRVLHEALQLEQAVRAPIETFDRGPRPANTTQMQLGWTGLLDQGVLQSHELLVIDQDICTDCNNCVDACGRRHGRSRLERRGLQLDNLLFPTACRHCEDPVCLLCSVNGIVRLPDGEITIVEDSCIGCGACAQRCPYGNIRMHPLEEQKESYLQRMLDFAFARGRQAPPVAGQHDPKVAVKCDLCAGHADYACVTACPVGAAFRIDPVQAFGERETFIGLEMKQQKAQD